MALLLSWNSSRLKAWNYKRNLLQFNSASFGRVSKIGQLRILIKIPTRGRGRSVWFWPRNRRSSGCSEVFPCSEFHGRVCMSLPFQQLCLIEGFLILKCLRYSYYSIHLILDLKSVSKPLECRSLCFIAIHAQFTRIMLRVLHCSQWTDLSTCSRAWSVRRLMLECHFLQYQYTLKYFECNHRQHGQAELGADGLLLSINLPSHFDSPILPATRRLDG